MDWLGCQLGEAALQFGHGTDAVDDTVNVVTVPTDWNSFNSATALMPWMTRLSRSVAVLCCRFNSATALMPWMTQRAVEIFQRGIGLQFGHGTDAVDDISSNFLVQRGTLRFNSATALMPWMTAPCSEASGAEGEASIRPRH